MMRASIAGSLLLLLMMAVGGVFANQVFSRDATHHGVGDFSCVRWTGARARRDSASEDVMVAWTEGYLSARVSDGVVTDASDVEDIRAFYDDYCKAKPTVTLFDAVNDWIEQRRNEIKYSN